MENNEKYLVAKNIKELAVSTGKRTGKNIVQLAEKAGISKAAFYTYMNGEFAPSIFTLKKLCKIFNCSYECILGKVE